MWYKDDFGGNDAALVKNLRKHAGGQLAEQLDRWDGGLDHQYDWRLNDLGD